MPGAAGTWLSAILARPPGGGQPAATAGAVRLSSRSARRRGENALDVRFGEELRGRRLSGEYPGESVHRLLVAVDRAEQLLHLGGRRLHLGEVASELIGRQDVLVAPGAIGLHRVIEWTNAREPDVHRLGAEL